jgi:hypothetical protein
MGELFKEHPFKIAGCLVAAGVAAWLGWSWLAISIAFVVGLVVGAIIDASGEK